RGEQGGAGERVGRVAAAEVHVPGRIRDDALAGGGDLHTERRSGGDSGGPGEVEDDSRAQRMNGDVAGQHRGSGESVARAIRFGVPGDQRHARDGRHGDAAVAGLEGGREHSHHARGGRGAGAVEGDGEVVAVDGGGDVVGR